MIARVWTGAVRREDGDAYAAYMRETGVAAYATTPGNRGVWMLRRDVDERTEFAMLTLWDSLEAVKAFAGDAYETAVFYPEDERFLVERNLCATHYVVEEERGPDDRPPELEGERVVLRPLRPDDVERIAEIQAEPGVARWWGEPDEAELRSKAEGRSHEKAFTIEADGAIIGSIEYAEEAEPDFRHAGIDLFLTRAVAGPRPRDGRDPHAGGLSDPRATSPQAHDRPGGRQRGRDPRLREGRLSARRPHARVLAVPGRGMARRSADGPARARARRVVTGVRTHDGGSWTPTPGH